jgi:hypothetical protein
MEERFNRSTCGRSMPGVRIKEFDNSVIESLGMVFEEMLLGNLPALRLALDHRR